MTVSLHTAYQLHAKPLVASSEFKRSATETA
ncbi:hypothetical protein SVAN01_06700 [Stagonosporopsis vannaccii]|nr:hypothetical protein SVAN01_06700 [Stagonosporopsis vannaccii]